MYTYFTSCTSFTPSLSGISSYAKSGTSSISKFASSQISSLKESTVYQKAHTFMDQTKDAATAKAAIYAEKKIQTTLQNKVSDPEFIQKLSKSAYDELGNHLNNLFNTAPYVDSNGKRCTKYYDSSMIASAITKLPGIACNVTKWLFSTTMNTLAPGLLETIQKRIHTFILDKLQKMIAALIESSQLSNIIEGTLHDSLNAIVGAIAGQGATEQFKKGSSFNPEISTNQEPIFTIADFCNELQIFAKKIANEYNLPINDTIFDSLTGFFQDYINMWKIALIDEARYKLSTLISTQIQAQILKLELFSKDAFLQLVKNSCIVGTSLTAGSGMVAAPIVLFLIANSIAFKEIFEKHYGSSKGISISSKSFSNAISEAISISVIEHAVKNLMSKDYSYRKEKSKTHDSYNVSIYEDADEHLAYAAQHSNKTLEKQIDQDLESRQSKKETSPSKDSDEDAEQYDIVDSNETLSELDEDFVRIEYQSNFDSLQDAYTTAQKSFETAFEDLSTKTSSFKQNVTETAHTVTETVKTFGANSVKKINNCIAHLWNALPTEDSMINSSDEESEIYENANSSNKDKDEFFDTETDLVNEDKDEFFDAETDLDDKDSSVKAAQA